MMKQELLGRLDELLTAAQTIRKAQVGIFQSADCNGAWQAFLHLHQSIREGIEKQPDDITWNEHYTGVREGNQLLAGPKEAETKPTIRELRKGDLKHTCGKDGVENFQMGGGQCQVCIQESRQQTKETHIANPVCSKCGKPMLEARLGEAYRCTNKECPGKWQSVPKSTIEEKPIFHPVETIDNKRFLESCCVLAAELDNAVQNLSGPNARKSIEYCQKTADQMIEGLRGGQESIEAKERYKDRLAKVTTAFAFKMKGEMAIREAVKVLEAIDKHCEERNK